MIRLLLADFDGGSANARSIFDELGRSGFAEVVAVVPERIALDPVYAPDGWRIVSSDERPSSYRLVPVALKDPIDYYRAWKPRSLFQVISDFKPDLIHCLNEAFTDFLFQAVWLSRVAAPRSKVVFYGMENMPLRLPRRSRLKWRPTWRWVAGGAAANSECLRNVSAAGFPKGRPLELIFWGIPTDIFKPLGDPRLKERLSLGYPSIVGFVGRRRPEKGLAVLLDAFRKLPAGVHLLMIGSGPSRQRIMDEYGGHDLEDRVHVIDPVDPYRLCEYLNCMDVLTLPSLTTSRWKEQYGRVIVEAMACGVPVAASDSGAIPEVVADAGRIVPENDPFSLADALIELIFDQTRRSDFIERGLSRVRGHLSVKAMVARLISFYERILAL